MLSEGEMVVPADVVRYFGVEHFMKLRDEAKMGYKKMTFGFCLLDDRFPPQTFH